MFTKCSKRGSIKNPPGARPSRSAIDALGIYFCCIDHKGWFRHPLGVPRQHYLVNSDKGGGPRVFRRKTDQPGPKVEFKTDRPFAFLNALKLNKNSCYFLQLEAVLAYVSHLWPSA